MLNCLTFCLYELFMLSVMYMCEVFFATAFDSDNGCACLGFLGQWLCLPWLQWLCLPWLGQCNWIGSICVAFPKVQSLTKRLLKVCYMPATSAGLSRLLFLRWPLTVLMKQTRQVVCTLKQSLLLRCL
jgi:hypothetical protein